MGNGGSIKVKPNQELADEKESQVYKAQYQEDWQTQWDQGIRKDARICFFPFQLRGRFGLFFFFFNVNYKQIEN